ncbi:speckle-type POZ protein B-like [Planococcus citri]|uniref:speckle-type POZ protein B-like n=1 Tax=Planococcus citri TaxID=170843 RepID=UPI0031FA1291
MSASIQCNPSAITSVEGCWCSTVQVDELKHTWKVDNFSIYEEYNDFIESTAFSVRTDDECQWHLQLRPNGDCIELYLFLNENSKCKRVFAKFSINILNNAQHVIYSTDFLYYEFMNNKNWNGIFEKYEGFYGLIPNDSLTISLQLMYFKIDEGSIAEIFRGCNTAHLQNYSENFVSMLENRKFSDFTLSVRGKDYPVHKVILAARSNYFAKMFESGMKENEVNRVEITDVKEDVMNEILKFIYAGKCANVDKLADDLLAAANKYDIDQLKKICLKTISKSISVDNAPNLLVLADLYHENELKSKVIDFMLTRSIEVKNSRAWNNIMPMYPKLLNEVCSAAFLRLSDASGSGSK